MTLALVLLAAPVVFGGRVLDASTGEPVPLAIVRLQATGHASSTDAAGAFELRAEAEGEPVIAAAAKGYYTGSIRAGAAQTGLKILLEPVTGDDDPGYELREPGFCAGCHPAQTDDWARSAMAHAGRNAWVHDTYDGSGTAGGMGGFVYVRDSLHAASAPASECRACHEPTAWIRAPSSAMEGPSDEGVTCDVCHKIADVDETRLNFPGLHTGAVRLSRPGPGRQVQYGLLGDVDFSEPAQMRASYQPQLASVVCATCHQDRNDADGDGDFEDEPGAISEPTYLEWLESPYGDPSSDRFETCAGCHMARTESGRVCSALYPPLVRDPERVRRHDFPGTTPEYLERALSLALVAKRAGSRLEVEVEVTNEGAGHHVPTGVTIRNVILLVEAVRARDGAPLAHLGDQVVDELGGVGDPARGHFAGMPGKVYAKRNHGPDGEGPVFYTEATGILSDTRIPALATDTTRYAFELPQAGGDVEVRARLLYRRAFRALVDAKGWTEDGHGRPLADLAPPSFGHVMAEASALVPLDEVARAGPAGGCGCAAGRGGSLAAALLSIGGLLSRAVTRRRSPRRRAAESAR